MSKGRIVGFAALAALVILVGAAVWSSREAAPGDPGAPAVPLDAGLPGVEQPSLTQSVPTLPRQQGSIVSATIEDVVLSPQARLLAERFQCVCGCEDILATCTCKETPGSRDMKQYLQELVNGGKTPAEVESAMVARYGQNVIP